MSIPAQAATPSESTLELLQRIDYRRADSEEDREAVFRLRYEAYVREGMMAPQLTRRLTDKYDETAWIFGLYLDGKLVSSIRVNVGKRDDPDGPDVQGFADHVMPWIEAGLTIVDPSRIVVDQQASRLYPKLAYLTARLGWLAGDYFSADRILTSCRLEHQAFYRRVFGHRPVCGPRPYLLLKKPLTLMVLDYPAERERVHQRYPFFRSSLFERRMLFDREQPLRHRSAA